MSYYIFEFHRGGRDARPENTLQAFQYSLENGASSIETDIQMTADGHIVIAHNVSLNPDVTIDSEGRYIENDGYYIRDMTLDQVQSFNVGRMDQSSGYYALHGRSQVQADAFVPTLRQVFELMRDSGNKDTMLSVEGKGCPDPAQGYMHENNYDYDALIRKFLSLVDEFGFRDRVTFRSFDWEMLVRLKKIEPGIETIALYSEQPAWGTPDATTLWLDRDEASPWLSGLDIHDFDGDPVRAAHSLGIDSVSPYFKEITKELTDEAHSFGMKVVPWTVNNIEDMEALYEMGVDGMTTDRPWVMRAFLEKKGEKLLSPMETGLPYHLEPDHYEVEYTKDEKGRDAAH